MLKLIKYIPLLFFACQLTAQKGDVTIGASYGVPHLYKNVVKLATRTEVFKSAFNGTLEISKIKGVNPISARALYAITDHFELGVSICRWDMNLSVKDYYNVQQAGNVLGRDEIDTYQFKITSTSFGVRPNYVSTRLSANGWYQLYIGAGIGYTSNNLSIGFSSTDIGKVFPNLRYSLSLPGGLYFAPTIGIRDYFGKNGNFGVNLELGYEKGAVLQAGIVIKIRTKKKG